MEAREFHEKTPNGGDYWRIVFTDSKGRIVEEKEATNFIITEYSKDGEPICNTYGFYDPTKSKDMKNDED